MHCCAQGGHYRRNFLALHDSLPRDTQRGYLAVSQEDYEAAKPNIHIQAGEFLEYGESKEGHWTGERFMRQLEMAVRIAAAKYPTTNRPPPIARRPTTIRPVVPATRPSPVVPRPTTQPPPVVRPTTTSGTYHSSTTSSTQTNHHWPPSVLPRSSSRPLLGRGSTHPPPRPRCRQYRLCWWWCLPPLSCVSHN